MSLRILTYYARLVGRSLDSLVGELEPEYADTALDRKLQQTISKLDTPTKEKLLKPLNFGLNNTEKAPGAFRSPGAFSVLLMAENDSLTYRLRVSC